MTVSLDQIHAKAKAFVDALCKLPRSQYGAPPSGQFGRDFNRLRELALAAAPGIDARLLADEVAVRQTASGETCIASYVEIETYARQIMEQLALLTAHRPGTAVPRQAGNGEPAKTYDVDEIRREHPQAYQPWTAQDDEHLRACFYAGTHVNDLADELGRQPGAIRSRLRKLGLEG